MLRVASAQYASGLGAIVVTPGQMLDEMNAVDKAVDELAIRITQQFTGAGTNTLWVNAWTRWRQEWKQFYSDHQDWTARLFYGTYEKTLEYRSKLADWRTQFEQMQGQSVGPSLSPLPPSAVPFTEQYKPLIITGGLIAGATLVWLILRRTRPVQPTLEMS
jgi:hypothetical protein